MILSPDILRAMDAIDIWRTAGTLIAHYGKEASLIAAKRADSFLANGEMDAWSVWKGVINAIAEIERGTLRDGERPN